MQDLTHFFCLYLLFVKDLALSNLSKQPILLFFIQFVKDLALSKQPILLFYFLLFLIQFVKDLALSKQPILLFLLFIIFYTVRERLGSLQATHSTFIVPGYRYCIKMKILKVFLIYIYCACV